MGNLTPEILARQNRYQLTAKGRKVSVAILKNSPEFITPWA